MKSTPLISFRSTEYYHVDAGFAADSARARLPWRVFQRFTISFTIAFPAIKDLLVCVQAVNHLTDFHFTESYPRRARMQACSSLIALSWDT